MHVMSEREESEANVLSVPLLLVSSLAPLLAPIGCVS